MSDMAKCAAACALAMALLVPSADGAPLIKVDSADFDLGKIQEGSTEKVTHSFVLKNIGDENLVIKEVKPG